ncbi:mandelate racemase/muconate lactonizing enzyme family protein [Halosimplex amylolyticum]|uniref:mandelate racemase/muconate lactonizing enzyme family protein n=1 Tax=Halosimplex amylolyticum TaxID=3396616 RepID=UPI003F545958
MEITGISAVLVEGNFDWPLVRVETDEGVTGYGEVRDHGRGQFDPAETFYVDDPLDLALALEPELVGEDPTNVAERFEAIRRYGGWGRAGGGVSGVEMALWDAYGKSVGEPVWKLLGGKYRDDVRVYCDCRAGEPVADSATDYALDANDYTPEGYADHAAQREAEGFDFLKFDLMPSALEHVTGEAGVRDGNVTKAGLDYVEEVTASIREAVSADTDVGFDCYELSRFPVSDAVRFAERLDGYDLAVVEDVVPDDDVSGWSRVTDAVATPTITGEDLYTVDGFRPLIESGAVDVVGPDLLTAGGIRETKRICTFANQHGMPANLHFAGSPVGFAASVHAAAAVEDLLGLEFHAVGVPWWGDLVEESLFADGRAPVPEDPGLGVTLDEDAIFAHAREDQWVTN